MRKRGFGGGDYGLFECAGGDPVGCVLLIPVWLRAMGFSPELRDASVNIHSISLRDLELLGREKSEKDFSKEKAQAMVRFTAVVCERQEL